MPMTTIHDRSLTPRENLLRVLAFDSPEWTPTGVPVHGLSYVGASHEDIGGDGGDGSPAGARWRDIWGVGWRKELPGVMGMPEHNPLSDLSLLDRHPFPDPFDPRIAAPIHADRLDFDRDGAFLAGFHRDTLFEQAYMLVGMEPLFIAFHEQPDAVKELFQRIIDFHLGLARQYVERGVEWAFMGDDLGTQRGPLFRREVLEEFFVPEYRRLLGFYTKRGVRINFHSCGKIDALADVFMNLGVSVLNPVQATANDLTKLRGATMGRMTLMGAIPSHVVLEGPVEAIREAVRDAIARLGRRGRYICAPDQGLPFPPAHLEALNDAVAGMGRFPIELPPPAPA